MTPPPEPHPDRERLASLRVPGWDVRFLAETPSTNAVAARGAADRLVVVTDHQTAGRGRLDRTWETPAGLALTVSVVVDPGVPDDRWPWLPLVTGLAVLDAVRAAGLRDAALKWPNDVLAGSAEGGKLAGILCERVAGPYAVLGVGLNVHGATVPTGASLAGRGVPADRADVLAHLLAALDVRLAALREDPAGVRTAYAGACGTLGQSVEVHLPDGSRLTGTAEDVDALGRLVVAGRAVSAGDVVHVRRERIDRRDRA